DAAYVGDVEFGEAVEFGEHAEYANESAPTPRVFYANPSRAAVYVALIVAATVATAPSLLIYFCYLLGVAPPMLSYWTGDGRESVFEKIVVRLAGCTLIAIMATLVLWLAHAIGSVAIDLIFGEALWYFWIVYLLMIVWVQDRWLNQYKTGISAWVRSAISFATSPASTTLSSASEGASA
ncbi:MAG: hypothetical protein AAFP90_12790, partial [Planctomycetota bacterium]